MLLWEDTLMEKHYFVPVVNRVYTNRNDKQYRCTGFVEGSCRGNGSLFYKAVRRLEPGRTRPPNL